MCYWIIQGFEQTCYSLVIYGLMLDIIGAFLIAAPLLNVIKRFKEELDVESTKKEYLDSKKNASISMRNPNKKFNDLIDFFANFSDTLMRGSWAIKDQKYVRAGIILLVLGFGLQIIGNLLQHWEYLELR